MLDKSTTLCCCYEVQIVLASKILLVINYF